MTLSLVLFLIGILGFIGNRKNIILMIISIEIVLLAVTLLALLNPYQFDDIMGQRYGTSHPTQTQDNQSGGFRPEPQISARILALSFQPDGNAFLPSAVSMRHGNCKKKLVEHIITFLSQTIPQS